MKIAVITSRYPSENNPYNHMFVHSRCVNMVKEGQSVVVYVPSSSIKSYTHEGVKVKVMPSVNINRELGEYDILYLHLLNIYPFSKRNGWLIYKNILNNNLPFVMYVHGSEVQKYKARMFEFNYRFTDFLKWIKKDILVIPKMKKFLQKTIKRNQGVAYVFPSIWMKNELEKNLDVTLKQFYIIPNGIDTSLFEFHELYPKKYKLLTLRPLSSKKYAVDLAIDMMQYLPEHFTLDIYGKGHFEKKYLKQIQHLNLEHRIKIKNSFIERCNLNDFFKNYGVFLVPTRMDAQGVSMCEAMSSGLLIVSSNNTAIPEFVDNMNSGIIGDNLRETAYSLINVIEDQNQYSKITVKARASMEKIDMNIILKKELNLLKETSSIDK